MWHSATCAEAKSFNGPVVYDDRRVRRDLLMESDLHKAGGHGLKGKGLWRSARLGGATS